VYNQKLSVPLKSIVGFGHPFHFMTIDDIKLKGFAGLSSVETEPIKHKGRHSNGDYLKHLCDQHDLIGPLIIQAINRFCEIAIMQGDELIAKEKKQMEEGVVPMFSNELWVECAKFVRLQNYNQYEEAKHYRKEEFQDANS